MPTFHNSLLTRAAGTTSHPHLLQCHIHALLFKKGRDGIFVWKEEKQHLFKVHLANKEVYLSAHERKWEG